LAADFLRTLKESGTCVLSGRMLDLNEMVRSAGRRLRRVANHALGVRSRLTGRPPRAVLHPNHATLDFLARTRCRTIAEIGVATGSTSEGILRYLNGEGILHLFDRDDVLEPVSERLHGLGYRNFVCHGNSRRTLDSYNWSLMKLLRDHPAPFLDYVYLDGAHTWAHDALAFCLIDRLLLPGGYIDFDDHDWTINGSPTVNPRAFPTMRKLYTEEQMATPQVRMIVDLLVRPGNRYAEVVPNKIFRKL
jgi:hypothetical protein